MARYKELDVLRAELRAKAISYRDLAKEVKGVSHSALHNFINNKKGEPTYDMVAKVVKSLGKEIVFRDIQA